MLKRVIENQQGKSHKTTIVVKGDSNQPLHIRNCDTVTIKNALVENWQAEGDVVKGKPNAIQLTNCRNVIIEMPIVKGAPDESNKDSWRNSVCNGIRIDDSCSQIQIIEPDIERVHFGLDVRGETSVQGGKIRFISGDHALVRGDNCTLSDIESLDSLFVLPYSLIHRDYVQLIKLGSGYVFIKNVLIQSCVMRTNPDSHKWAEDPDQAITLTDGHGENITIIGNHIATEKDIAILMNPCHGLTIKSNIITSTKKPSISCEDRKHTGCQIRDVEILENYYQLPFGSESKRRSFSELCVSVRNTNAPALSAEDYEKASRLAFISPAMIAAVAKVESSGTGYNSDGNIRTLLERHWVYKLASRANCLKPILDSAGSENCNRKAGGYKGGKAEYKRIQSVADADHDEALNIALSSFSMGMFQIMGFNHLVAGYDTPLEMFIDFHKSESVQLQAFLSFISSKGLVQHLRDAEDAIEAGKSPLKALNEFAIGYNGKQHKDYHLKILKAYEIELAKTRKIEVKKTRQDEVVQGGGVATGANVIAAASAGKVLFDQITETRKAVEDLKDQATEIAEQSSNGDILLWIAIAFIILNQLGVVRAVWSKIKERRTGKSL